MALTVTKPMKIPIRRSSHRSSSTPTVTNMCRASRPVAAIPPIKVPAFAHRQPVVAVAGWCRPTTSASSPWQHCPPSRWSSLPGPSSDAGSLRWLQPTCDKGQLRRNARRQRAAAPALPRPSAAAQSLMATTWLAMAGEWVTTWKERLLRRLQQACGSEELRRSRSRVPAAAVTRCPSYLEKISRRLLVLHRRRAHARCRARGVPRTRGPHRLGFPLRQGVH